MSQLLWQPSAQQIAQSEMSRLTERIRQLHSLDDNQYATLHQWSVDHPDLFWEQVWQDCDIVASRSHGRVMGEAKMPGTVWFEGARLNFAEIYCVSVMKGERPFVFLMSAAGALP